MPGRPGAGPSPVPCPHAARLLAVLGPGHPPPLAGASAPQDTSGLRPQALGPEDGLHSRLCLRGTRGGSNGLGGGSRDRVRCLGRAGREPPHGATPCPRPVSTGGRGRGATQQARAAASVCAPGQLSGDFTGRARPGAPHSRPRHCRPHPHWPGPPSPPLGKTGHLARATVRPRRPGRRALSPEV